MKRPVVIVAVVVALIVGAVAVGWLYFRLTPGAWESFLAQMQQEEGVGTGRSSVGRPRSRDEELTASGNIEGEEITVASEDGGRVREVLVKKGDTVTEDHVVLQLDRELPLSQQEQAEASVSRAEAALRAARAQLEQARAGARPQEVAMAESELSSSEASQAAARAQLESAQGEQEMARARRQAARGELDAARADQKSAAAALERLRAGASAEEIAVAERRVKAAENDLWGAQAQRDAICGHVNLEYTEADCDGAEAAVGAAWEQVRIAELQLQELRAGAHGEDIAAAEARVAQARAGVEVARASVGASEAAVTIAEAAVDAAETNVEMAKSQAEGAEASLDLTRAGVRDEEIEMLEAQVQEAEAGLAQAQAALRASKIRMERTTLRAPMEGTVVDLLVHDGELAAPNSPLLTLVNLDELTLTVYVPQADVGLVSLHQEVEVTVDAYEDAFIGRVSHIASQAEFTPERVQTPEERVHMVFAVEISLDNPERRLKSGMPADAVFQ
ncbi:MAG: HlyD family efflux transporter periplasmic adaptor subunit [Anaerolineae bacterium]